MKLQIAATALAVGACAAVAPAASAHAPARVSVAGLNGSGDWVMDQVYDADIGVHFKQHFTFAKRAGRVASIPAGGGSVKVPIRVHVESAADGTYSSGSGLKSYTCTATSDTNAKATVSLARRGAKLRVTTTVLEELAPGSPDCTEPGAAWWPTDTDLFERALRIHADVSRASLLKPIPLQFPETTADCGEPALVAACSEKIAWSGTLKMQGQR
ncbi:hypothetical protein OM076_00025 [Solirubrobacter ginsenosidimutans]|uniref:Htaa domain-containing protein n=1 Tax=Solirubrobacter ginsenosidimutans TaxID=490573 RepID=A0A9X3MS45_9ACTN|nr:hypothetical protein [Solirubrobacter ginsenosidimutans]MDA0158633.1 hypothetical protein [Solirubrobacter ginsenosidimutans]